MHIYSHAVRNNLCEIYIKFIDDHFTVNQFNKNSKSLIFKIFLIYLVTQKDNKWVTIVGIKLIFYTIKIMMIKFSVEGFSTAIKKFNNKGLEIFDTQSALGHDRSNLSPKRWLCFNSCFWIKINKKIGLFTFGRGFL